MKKISLNILSIMITVFCASATLAQETNATLQIITKSGTQASVKGTAEVFTGSVRIDPLFERKAGVAEFSAAYVTFEPGARSFWHIHPTGQHLVVTQGTGWTGTVDGVKFVIQAGDVVWCPPGVKHWHGATATTSMTHMAITGYEGDKNVEWLEPATDEQYDK